MNANSVLWPQELHILLGKLLKNDLMLYSKEGVFVGFARLVFGLCCHLHSVT